MWVAWRLILARNSMAGRLVTNSLILQLNSALKYGSENNLERELTDRIVDQLWSELPSFTVQSVFFSASLFTIQEKIWRALPVHKNFSLKAKQCTKICFWKHFRRQIGDAVTKIWLIFDQRCLLNFSLIWDLKERKRGGSSLSLSLHPTFILRVRSINQQHFMISISQKMDGEFQSSLRAWSQSKSFNVAILLFTWVTQLPTTHNWLHLTRICCA